MPKYWWLVFLGLFVVGLGVVAVGYYYRLTIFESAGALPGNDNSTISEHSRLPRELTSEFDPTVNTPVFKAVADKELYFFNAGLFELGAVSN